MKILIAGCGYVGAAFGQAMAKAGHQVWGIRRNWGTEGPEGSGPSVPIRLIQADLLDPKTLSNLPVVDWVLFSQSPSKKDDSYRKTYFQATANLLNSFKQALPKKIVFISSTSVYGNSNGEWVDEKTPANTSDSDARILLETEKLILSSKFPSVVVRLAGIYGPGRNRLKPILSGEFKPALDDNVFTNRIHRDDIVQAIQLLFEKAPVGEIFIGADDSPCTQKEFYEWIYQKLGIPLPEAGGDKIHPHRSNKRCRNAKLAALGLKLRYRNFKEGYEELIRDYSPAQH